MIVIACGALNHCFRQIIVCARLCAGHENFQTRPLCGWKVAIVAASSSSELGFKDDFGSRGELAVVTAQENLTHRQSYQHQTLSGNIIL